MHESRRRAYLKALGIDLYQAREPLPFAAASPDWEALLAPPEQSDEVAPQPRQTLPADEHDTECPRPDQSLQNASPAEPAPSGTDSNDLAEVRVIPPHPNPAEQKQVTPPNKADKVSHLRFVYYLSKPHNGLLCMALLQDSVQKALSVTEKALLQDLLLAVYGAPYPLEQGQYFRWPIVETRVVQTDAEAAEALRSFMEVVHSRNPYQVVLAFGDLEKVPPVQEGSAIALHHGSVQVVPLPSMEQMLSDWRNKAEAWRQLRQVLNR